MITYPDHLQSKIGKVVRALRKSIGYSHAEMADYLELPLSDIKAYETGDKDISVYTYLKITEIIPKADKIKAYYDYYARAPRLD